MRGKETKRILKSAFARVLPREVIDRKKAGFPVPYEGWLRSEFREQLRDLLLSNRSSSRGYFEKSGIERMLESGVQSGPCSNALFSLAVLELWNRQFIDARSNAEQH